MIQKMTKKLESTTVNFFINQLNDIESFFFITKNLKLLNKIAEDKMLFANFYQE